jgi:hypothetical protein
MNKLNINMQEIFDIEPSPNNNQTNLEIVSHETNDNIIPLEKDDLNDAYNKSKDNLENKLDGACARYLNYRKKL